MLYGIKERPTDRVSAAAVLSAVLAVCLSATAQEPYGDPALVGQWAGPWDLDAQINDHSDQTVPAGATLVEWGEITHAATLPPPNDGYVLFWCERPTPCHQLPTPLHFIPYETFFWHPRSPGDVEAVFAVPTPGDEGTLDLFCGGHTFTEDGRLVSCGGQDHRKTCNLGTQSGQPETWGTTGVFLFDNALYDGLQPEPAWHKLLPGLQRAHWYPTVTRDHSGKFTVWGHQFEPAGANPETWFTRERFDIPDGVVGIVWDPIETPVDLQFRNYTSNYFPSTPCLEATPLIGLRGYPRVEPILDPSSPVRADMVALSGFLNAGGFPVSSYYLDLDACGTSAEVERWYQGTAGPAPIAFAVAHFVDMTGAVPKEVIYAIGGDEPSNPGGDPTAPDNCLTFTNKVVKIVDPHPLALWKGEADGVPQLAYSRKHLQAVIGLDGGIYTFGGKGRRKLPGGGWDVCDEVRLVERYRPPEIFATPSQQWKFMVEQTDDRGHHSVAGLLPDGRMYSAGGDHAAGEAPSAGERSVEIYSPEYLFNGARPRITNVSNPEPLIGATITLQVEISGSAASEFRVALVPPGTMTHGYNFNQRYVKLKVVNPLPGSPFDPPPQSNTIEVQIPSDAHIVPPGNYLITVVRDNGVPSVGKWIRVKLP